PHTGPQPADHDHGVALADARRDVGGQCAKAGDIDPSRVAIAVLTTFAPYPWGTRQPESGHAAVTPDVDLGPGVAGHLYQSFHCPSLCQDAVRGKDAYARARST